MKTWLLIGIIGLSTAGLSAQASDDTLDAAKSLYLSASYQEALAALDRVNGDGTVADEAAKYKALCLLGLNRPEDAEQTIERLVSHHPFFELDPFDSPKLQVMFADVRTKVLPGAATKLYEAAKGAFERGELAIAKDQFASVLTLLSRPEIASQPSVPDLEVLADGFAKLIDQRIALQRETTAAAVAAVAADPAARSAEHIFDENDHDVVPPVPIDQFIPVWTPPNSIAAAQTYKGTMEIVVDTDGSVASATITQATIAPYDQLLLSAARTWHYRPASHAAQMVKYRKIVNVTLRPR